LPGGDQLMRRVFGAPVKIGTGHIQNS